MSIWFLAICVAAFVVPYALVAFAIRQENKVLYNLHDCDNLICFCESDKVCPLDKEDPKQ
tara:strand:- start:1157 stop:1336 length:180 start_codon:yes stop_codon:yes gene_type:complete